MPEDLGQKIILRLRGGQLPKMVDWFDPALLVRIGIRDIISGTIGQYADQRLMQAASDHVTSEQELAHRYDYSNFDAADPLKRVKRDQNGAVWVDYIADLGDGFEATYAVASLMAPETLTVTAATEGMPAVTLPAGNILIMGGDQAYPQATDEEYENRLIKPYSWAFRTNEPERKLFAIPGNHDWYDGLGAFTSLFTAARSRISGGLGRQIGGWRSMQHRSYFAIKLPHDWWIWGPDVQLEGHLDDPQRDYFDIVGDYTKPGDKIVLCLAEPSWHHQNYDNLHEINLMARKRGAKICAILAGDWHHYSRYTNEDLGIQFITSGGGGAFAHASHQLKKSVVLDWAIGTEDAEPDHAAEPAPAPSASATSSRSGFYPAHSAGAAGAAAVTTIADAPRPVYRESGAGEPVPQGSRYDRFKSKFRNRRKGQDRRHAVRYKKFDCTVRKIYPSPAGSRRLALKNLTLPFRNRSFALFVGFIYFLYAWVFQTSAPELDKKLFEVAKTGAAGTALLNDTIATLSRAFWAAISPERVLQAATSNPAFFFMLLGLWAGLVYYVELGKGFFNSLGKFVIGTAHFLTHLNALLVVTLFAYIPSFVIAAVPALFFLPAGGEAGGTGWMGAAIFLVTYSAVAILLGGFIGALIMGLYWTFTSLALNMHCGDAFGALGIRDYKHFLRMKFEADKLTIYPIAVDKVPGPKGWRPAATGEGGTNNAQVVPVTPLAPHLIEDPIVIRSGDVPMTFQRVDDSA